jgi:acetyl esterase/lipase
MRPLLQAGLTLLLLTGTGLALPAATEPVRPRVIVLADMGNEPDEVQQMLHLLVCANTMEIEGLIAVTGKYLRPDHREEYRRRLHPELFHQLIDGYERVRLQLAQHAAGWPEPANLRGVVVEGQTGYGIAATGEGQASAGSRLILAAATRPDPRPLHLIVNAGSNTLAQALRDYRAAHSPAETAALVARLRVFENGAQDDAGAWIMREFPALHWVRSNHQTYSYGGPNNENLGPSVWAPHPDSPAGQDAWAQEHIRTGHGALGEMYPPRLMGGRTHFIEGGGTIPWLGFVAAGLGDSGEPSWGGWSGRFTAEKVPNPWSRHADIRAAEESGPPFAAHVDARDRWTDPASGKLYDDIHTPVFRWRRAMWNDFRARLDWCVQPFAQANHHPRAALDGDTGDGIVRLSASPGQVLTFDASASSDPDGDALDHSWWIYPEAGRAPYGREISLEGVASPRVSLTVPADAAGKELHLILEVTDRHREVRLTDYRRVVIQVIESVAGPAAPAGTVEIPLWEAAPPVPGGEFAPPAAYDELWQNQGGNWRVRQVTAPSVYFFPPAPAKADGTALILAPGGGFNVVVLEREGWKVARRLAEDGIAVFVLKYRHFSPAVAAMDGRRALRLVRARAAEWGIDPRRVGLGGFSAGGGLTLSVVAWPEAPADAAADPLSALSARPDFLVPVYPTPWRRLGAEARVEPSWPPVFLVGSAEDEPAERVMDLAQRLAVAGVSQELHLFARGRHGFDLGAGLPNTERWPELFATWLRAQLDPAGGMKRAEAKPAER